MSGILGVIMVVLAIAGIAVVAYVIYYYVLCGLLAPTRRVMARVARKHHQVQTMGGGSGPEDAFALLTGEFGPEFGSSCDCFVTFEFDGRQQEFSVPMNVYTDIDEGDVGLLVHKGNLFRKFIKGAVGWSDPVKAQITPAKP